MKFADSHPQLIAAAVAATGVFFLGASILEFSFLKIKPPGAYVMAGLSIIFILAGVYFLVKARRGHLEPQGVTVADIRKQAIEKMESTELLSRIAREDPERGVREKALKRLEEIAA